MTASPTILVSLTRHVSSSQFSLVNCVQLKRTFLSGHWCWLERHNLQGPQALRQTLLHHHHMAAAVVGEDDRKR